jgi:peptidoglycan hydrolase-like protein with peptidoglycan-binding domain
MIRTKVATCAALAMALAVATPATAAPPRTTVAVSAVKPASQTKHVQQLLKSFGYTVVVDGIYGPQTTKAVVHFQKANRLLPDGVAGPLTVARLEAAASTAGLAPAVRVDPPDPQPVVVMTTEEIIRDVWAGESQFDIEKAVRTAKRESGPNLKVDAANFCCYGIFQIYFRAHRAWLVNYGVFQPSDLFDPRVNATVALALFHTSGWIPWNGGA